MFKLNDLLANKEAEIRHKKMLLPLEALRKQEYPPLRNFRSALQGRGISIIAEMKRKSPSGGPIRKNLNPIETARTYEAASAAAVSVLTDRDYFGGSEDDVSMVKSGCRLPVLRKEFIIDEYQIFESRLIGADAILLIVRILPKEKLRGFLETAGSLGLDCLVETRSEREIEMALEAGAKIVGVNNRDLDTLSTDLNTSLRLASRIPEDAVRVSESGIRTGEDVRMLAKAGFDSLLIGESLMRAGDVRAKIKKLRRA
jgi:indole-3-glycerol phosphate synthase